MAAEIVLTRGEEDCRGFMSAAVIERNLPEFAGRAAERLHTAPTLHPDSRGDGLGNERCIKRFARE
jgi:hypothetical protein